MRLEPRIDGGARSLGERPHGLAWTLLDQEGEPQEMLRASMLRMPAQHLLRNSLCFVRTTSVDRGPTEMKGLVSPRCGCLICVLVVVHAPPNAIPTPT